MFNTTVPDCKSCLQLLTQATSVNDQAQALMGECLLIHAVKAKNKQRKLGLCQEVLGDISGQRIKEHLVLPQLRDAAAKIVG